MAFPSLGDGLSRYLSDCRGGQWAHKALLPMGRLCQPCGDCSQGTWGSHLVYSQACCHHVCLGRGRDRWLRGSNRAFHGGGTRGGRRLWALNKTPFVQHPYGFRSFGPRRACVRKSFRRGGCERLRQVWNSSQPARVAIQAFSCSSMPDVPGTRRGSTRPLLQCSGRARARGRGIGGGCGGSAGSANRSDPNPSESAPVSIRSDTADNCRDAGSAARLGCSEPEAHQLGEEKRASRDCPQLFTPPNGPLDNKQLDHLHALAGQGPGRVGDIGPRTGSGAKVSLRTTEAPDPELDGESLSQPGPAEPATLERLLHSQTQILQQLATQRATSQVPLAMLLHGGNGGDHDELPKSASVKGIAARQLLTEHFKRKPEKVLASVRERLAVARRKGSAAELEPRDMYLHFTETVPLGSRKTLTHLAFLTAKMWEHSERGETEHLRALVGLTAVFAEQAAYDSGGLRLAHLLTCADEPPFAQTELHRAPRTEFPHAQLAEPRWVATQLAYLRDIEAIQEKSGKYARSPKPPDPVGDRDKDKGKWRNNKKGKGKQSDDVSGES